MFHSLCPECGRPLAPTEKDCPECDGFSALALASLPAHEAVQAQATPVLENVAGLESAVALKLGAPAESRSSIALLEAYTLDAVRPTLDYGDALVPAFAAEEVRQTGSEAGLQDAASIVERRRIPLALDEPVARLVAMPALEAVGADLDPTPPDVKLPEAKLSAVAAVAPPAVVPVVDKPAEAKQPAKAYRLTRLVPPSPPAIVPDPVKPAAAAVAMPPLVMPPSRPAEVGSLRHAADAFTPVTPLREPVREIAKPVAGVSPSAPEPTLYSAFLALPVLGPVNLKKRILVPRLALIAAPRPAPELPPVSTGRIRRAVLRPVWMLAYRPAARLMTPAGQRPCPAVLQCAPVMIPPSPMLTPKLQAFQDKMLRPVFPGRLVKKPPVPYWLVGALIGGTLLGAGFSNLVSVTPAHTEPTAVHSTAANSGSGTAASTSESLLSAAPSSLFAAPGSLARSIEVSGFRIEMGAGKKPEIEYIVVNHSASKLSGLNVYVTLHAADERLGQPPLCQFSFVTDNLEPKQAKQMSSAIEGARKAIHLPDWEDLRVEVQVGQ